MRSNSTYYEIATQWRAEIFLCAVYILLFGYLLIETSFLPYVMDNNESFSAFWHARNLYEFGLAKSFGLADESFAYHDAAHPYVHTHQGNFPRIFAVLIYALGARSIESQILVTTFTVGLASVLFAYRYFRTLANPMLALIAVLILMTDYVLVAQWQVVTYRVWHMFFVFSTLLCVHGIGGERRRLWLALTIVNYACLFYFELIFVAFVALFAGFYTAWVYRKDTRTVLVGWVCQLIGALVGLTILVIQLVLYLGWDDFVRDAYFTFVARNQFDSAFEFLTQLRDFYESHNIAFWYNLEDGSRFQKIGYFAASVLFYELQIHTPYFTVLTLILVGAYVLGYWLPNAPEYYQSATKSGSGTNTGNIILSFPVVISTGMVALYLLPRWINYDLDLTDFAALLTVSLLLLAVPLTGAILRSKLSGPTANAWLNMRWHYLMPNLFGILILLSLLPSVLYQVSDFNLSFDQGSMVLTVFVGVYFLLLVNLAAPFVWSTTTPAGRESYGRELLGRWIAGLLLYVSFFTLWTVYLDDSFYLGVPPRLPVLRGVDWIGWVGFIGFVTASYVVAVNLIGKSSDTRGLIFLPRQEMIESLGRFSLFITFASAFVAIAWRLFYQKYVLLWQEIAEQSFLSPLLLKGMLVVAILFGGFVVASGSKKIIGRDEVTIWRNVLAFFITGFCAYAIVYYLSPGYIFSGYRFRFVPFTVFHTELVVAIALYLVIRYLLHYWPRADGIDRSFTDGGVRFEADTPRFNGWASVDWRRWAMLGSWCVVAGLFAGLLIYWNRMQITYIRLLPPDHFSVFKKLSAAPYKGASFAVGNYAAPVAAYTGQWAYYDPALVEGRYVWEEGIVKFVTDDIYLWFSDKRANPDYKRPHYFICLVTQTFPSVLSRLKQERMLDRDFGGCSTQELVKMAREKRTGVYPRPELVAIDTEGQQRIGFDSWAIVKLHWDEKVGSQHEVSPRSR